LAKQVSEVVRAVVVWVAGQFVEEEWNGLVELVLEHVVGAAVVEWTMVVANGLVQATTQCVVEAAAVPL
jgi:hypothetical protein